MNNVKKYDKFFEEVDFTTPENKERLDIVKKRLSQIEIKNEFRKEIEFLKKIHQKLMILSSGVGLTGGYSPVLNRIAELKEIVENL